MSIPYARRFAYRKGRFRPTDLSAFAAQSHFSLFFALFFTALALITTALGINYGNFTVADASSAKKIAFGIVYAIGYIILSALVFSKSLILII